MACTTLLVGKNASYDGSTMIARNDDSGSGHFTAKKFVVVQPEEHPAVYRSVLSHVEIPLPGDPMRMTAMPNAVEGKGIWAAAGVNAANVGMTATETITSNPRVLGADPLVVYQPARGSSPRCPAASARRTSSIWCCPTSTPPARAWSGWASCWRPTVLTR
ncbi:MAG: C69 family dipeptidase [Faecalibacterium sp.]